MNRPAGVIDMINPHHLLRFAVAPALQALDMDSPAARALVMGTAAQESRLTYLAQIGSGPARGLFQMEPATGADILVKWVRFRSEVQESLARIRPECEWLPDWRPKVVEVEVAPLLAVDLRFAAAMCRLLYRRVRAPLPDAGDVAALAEYWKRYYNTAAGKGRPAEFVENFELVRAALAEA